MKGISQVSGRIAHAARVAAATALLAALTAGAAGDWHTEVFGGDGGRIVEHGDWAVAAAAGNGAGATANVILKYAVKQESVKVSQRIWLKEKLSLSEQVAISFASGNPAVARVEANGLLTGVAAGKTNVTITVTTGGYTGRLTLPVVVAAAAPVGSPKKAQVKVSVSGKTYTVQTVTVPKGTPVTAGIAGRAVGQVQSLKAMANNYKADVAVNGTFFEAYNGPTDPYGTIIADGEVAHVGNYGTTIGFSTDGAVKMDALRVRVLGGTDGQNNWSGNWYAYFINRTPVKGSTSAVLFTPKRGARIGFAYGTAITVSGGIVTKIEKNVNAAIPKNGFVVVFMGSEEHLANRFKIGHEAHYETVLQDVNGNKVDWSRVHTAIGAGPRLVRNGAVSLDAAAEGFRDDKILTSAGARSGIGIKQDGTIIIATVPGATMKQWAAIMQKLGAYQAMNLDGGASSGLYMQGQTVTAEGRLLSNALLFGSKLHY
ncbi:Ig domain protein group 2 domain protein [Paenibacillus curdlanolyticus YK9]|uniref:Ig domain protein group 2 domain protein n=1 Tax=Paenibacillus curdlanolyticus YK9 TaxID=717606 RepID=E0I6C6_9BACL|nr:phosphodiester glycosidase family protein [Paenibacillus curdlanolyticus]EFM11592.1 Ig domain protein group 2 domain protein [Paenibacillus curdlanolyticus YK9]